MNTNDKSDHKAKEIKGIKAQAEEIPGEDFQTDPAIEETADIQPGAEKAAIGPEIISWPGDEEDPGADTDGDSGGGEMDGPDGGDCEVPG